MKRARRLAQRAIRRYRRSGSGHVCYVCGQTSRGFLPFRGGVKFYSGFVRDLDLVGSDVDHFTCPHCGCFDRERHLLMYFDRLDLWRHVRNGQVLHFAPEQHVAARIRSCGPAQYTMADLMPSRKVVQRMDVRATGLPDDSFDLVICNHVLEHVVDDNVALTELHRVTKPGGVCILQTPYSRILAHSFADPAVDTAALRERFYGQDDHVRVYGRDLFQKIVTAGFALSRDTHSSLLADIDADVHGVNPDEELIRATKPVSW